VAVISYVFIVGEIKRVELKDTPAKGGLQAGEVSEVSQARI
jgi:ACS family glucarate transporter-like MFS transporter